MIMKKIDHEYTKEIVCPYCGHEQSDSWEFSDSGDVDCGMCDETFDYERIVTVEYTTTKKQCIDHDYHIRKDYPYHISKKNIDTSTGKILWIPKSEEDYQYFRCMECSICQHQTLVEIQKGEYENETLKTPTPHR